MSGSTKPSSLSFRHRASRLTVRLTLSLLTAALLALGFFGASALAAPGDKDLGFGVEGSAVVDFFGGSDEVGDLCLDAAGRILVAGSAVDPVSGKSEVGLIRLLANGTLDPSFGANGVVSLDVGRGGTASAIITQPDGKIVVGGKVHHGSFGSSGDLMLLRLIEDGTLDPTFGTGGIAILDLGGNEMLTDLALQPDGGIVVVGTGEPAVLARFSADGFPDSSFGTDGRGDVAAFRYIRGVAIRPDGGIVVGGDTWSGPALASFDVDGSLLPAFGTGGLARLTPPGSAPQLHAFALHPDGRIVVAGNSMISFPFSDAWVAALSANGSLDATFGFGGFATARPEGWAANYVYAVGVQSDGKVVVGGIAVAPATTRSDISVLRYLPNGAPDTEFGLGGIAVSDFGKLEFTAAMGLQQDGKIVIGATSSSDPGRRDANMQVARFLGEYDNTPPAVVGVPDRPTNAAGWYRAPVLIDWQATDDSGVASDPPDTPAETEGVVTYTSMESCDAAGNCAVGTLTIALDRIPPDMTAPDLSTNPKPVEGTSALFVDASDATSGIAGGEYFVGEDPGPGFGIPLTDNAGVYSATLGHSWSVGVHQISVRMRDVAGNLSDPQTVLFVVFDPDGGFVTGGGWIDSPSGAYAPDPTLTGKATFGFVSKYKKGATVPEGNTEFQFKVAAFTFKSTSYDWLVVAGATAKYKGTGTVNGSGEYGFMLSAVDGALPGGNGVDKFRIKIWDKMTGVVIYDNQMGARETDDPTTALGGGSVVIHK